MTSLITVIIPCYNQAAYLPESIESLLAQSYIHWECIVVDDGSCDSTIEVAAEYVARDPRIRLITQSNHGVARARNRGIDEARGNWIQFLDSDDLLLQDKFARQLNVLDNCDCLALSYCDYYFCDAIDVRRRVFKPGDYEHPRLRVDDPVADVITRWETSLSIPIHSFLFDARLFKDYGIRFDEQLPNLEDWDCWVQILQKKPRIIPVHEELVVYRQQNNSRSTDKITMWCGYQQAFNKQMSIYSQDKHLLRLLKIKLRHMRHVYLGDDATFFTKITSVLRRGVFSVKAVVSRQYRKYVPWPIQKYLNRLFP